MSISNKSSNQAQFLRLLVYDRPLHPELFHLQVRRTDRHGEYEVEKWISAGGHVARFQAHGKVLTETVLQDTDHLPETGLVHALPCLGEKEYEMEPENGIGYVATLQTEQLNDNLYITTFREMQEFAHETGSLHYQWEDQAGTPCMTVLDTQKYKREFHVQSYHLLGSSGLVLRTQSLFEIV